MLSLCYRPCKERQLPASPRPPAPCDNRRHGRAQFHGDGPRPRCDPPRPRLHRRSLAARRAAQQGAPDPAQLLPAGGQDHRRQRPRPAHRAVRPQSDRAHPLPRAVAVLRDLPQGARRLQGHRPAAQGNVRNATQDRVPERQPHPLHARRRGVRPLLQPQPHHHRRGRPRRGRPLPRHPADARRQPGPARLPLDPLRPARLVPRRVARQRPLAAAKFETRISKSETNSNTEMPNALATTAQFRISFFGFVSDFVLRISNLAAKLGLAQPVRRHLGACWTTTTCSGSATSSTAARLPCTSCARRSPSRCSGRPTRPARARPTSSAGPATWCARASTTSAWASPP
jgi:hypothetical protein